MPTDPSAVKNPLIFVKELAQYYMDFLETDFHKRRHPKRSIKIRNDDGYLIGLELQKYPNFNDYIWKAINRSFANVPYKIEKGQYKADLPKNLIDLIEKSVDKITQEDIKNICEVIAKNIEENASLFKDEFDRALTKSLDAISKEFFDKLVKPFIDNLIKPLENLGLGDEGHIFVIEQDLTDILVKNVETKTADLLKGLILNEKTSVKDSLEESLDLEELKYIIKNFFSNLKAEDVFSEIYEIERNRIIQENQDFYLYFCDITYNKIKYPIFYLPFRVSVDKTTLKIDFDSRVFINKKALEYIAQEYNLLKGTQGTLKTILERIVFISSEGSFSDRIQNIISEIQNFFELNGNINLKDFKPVVLKSLFVQVSNSLHFCVFDKSDESLVNDYEAILEGLNDENGLIAEGFKVLINDFINENPKSVNKEVEDEWEGTSIDNKLVYSSPIPLNSEQRQVINAVNKNGCKYIIVEGPPGTGKSHTITALVCNSILNNRSVLVLSDKKEALDVVEDKITQTMNNVRIDKNFQNPVLRLGQTGNTYNQILSSSSIENIKTHYRAVRQNSVSLKENIEKYTNTLQEDINSEVAFYNKIQINEIQELIALEDKFKDDFIVFSEFLTYENAPEQIEMLREALITLKDELFNQSESNLKKLFNLNGDSFESIDDLILFIRELNLFKNNVLKIKDFYKDQIDVLGDLAEFSDKSLALLEGYIDSFDNIRKSFLWFIFKNNKIKDKNKEFLLTFPNIRYENPFNKLVSLKQIHSIFAYAYETKKNLGSVFLSRIDYLGSIHRFIQNPSYLDQLEDLIQLNDDIEYIKSFSKKFPLTSSKTNLTGFNLKNFSELIISNLSEAEFISELKFFSLKQKITNYFNNLPQNDYVGQKKTLESLITTQMTNVMDERVINFYQDSRADARALSEVIKSKQKFPIKEFIKLKESFPCILAGIRDYSEYIPLEGCVFDLLIIDEASQVSIAQALPALLRAKTIVVFGDRKQFSNVKSSQARTDSNSEYLERLKESFISNVSNEVTKLARFEKFNIKNSILEFIEFVANFKIQLLKHFRGYKELISYSNDHFYKNLQVMKIRGKAINEVLKFKFIEHDGQRESIPNTNKLEIDFIIEELRRIKVEGKELSVGIITPHTNQQKLIFDSVSNLIDNDYYFNELDLKIMTFDTCQGEERDVIYYSMVATNEDDKLWAIFIKDLNSVDLEEQGNIKAQRLNVGFSRAKECMYFVLSKPLDGYLGSVGQALRHYYSLLEVSLSEKSFEETDRKSPKEKEVMNWFYQTQFWKSNNKSIDFIPQFKVGDYLRQLDITYQHPKYKVDFLLVFNDSKKEHKIIIEYDGFEEHFKQLQNVNRYNYQHYYSESDVYRQKILMSYGYKFIRINKFNIGENPVITLNNRILDMVANGESPNSFIENLRGDIRSVSNGTKKICPKCDKLKDIEYFKDASLVTGIGRYCKDCKSHQDNEPAESSKPSGQNVRQVIEHAVKDGKVLEIYYKAKYGRLLLRRIKPIQINGHLLRAYCYFREADRTFSIDKIQIKRTVNSS